MKHLNFTGNFFKSVVKSVIRGGVLVFVLSSNTALADTSWTTGAYSNNEDRSQVLSVTGTTSLKVNVFGDTEQHYDYIDIYDKDENQIKKLHGNNLDETFEVVGDSIRVRLTTDSSVTRSGVTVSIEDNSVKDTLVDGTADSMLIRFTNTNQDQRNNNIDQLERAINQLVTTSNPITLTFVKYNSQFNTTVIDLSEAVVHDVIYRLVLKDYVTYSEPNVVFSVASATLEPNDPKYISNQWHYKAFTDTNGGINLPKAWAVTTGGVDSREVRLVKKHDSDEYEVKSIQNIVVAVIDTGITEHTDLVDNILKNDDGSVYGYDFYGSIRDGVYSSDSNPIGTGSHATHVSGTIAAESDNNEGVSGVNWQAKILPIRVLRGRGWPRGSKNDYALDISNAIIWAAGGYIENTEKDNVLHPANVINMSIWATVQCSNPYDSAEKSTIQNAINIATSLGATIVVAAGNDGIEASKKTPANCENVIAVSATDKDKNLSDYSDKYRDWRGKWRWQCPDAKDKDCSSNFGTTVDISAPGSNVWSTVPTDKYDGWGGTSMAAPHVAGVASLMLAQNPDLTPAQVEVIIKKSINSFPVNSTCTSDEAQVVTGTKEYCGTGIIDAYQAVVNSQVTLLTLNNAEPVNKSEHGQTLYKFKYLDTDGYSGVKEYNINFNRTAGTTHLYIKKNGLPDANDSNSYDCKVTYNGSSENNNEVSINACLKDIKVAYGDLLYIQTKVSGVSNGTQVGDIKIIKTHLPLWSGDLDVGQKRIHSISAGHGNGDLKLKFTLIEVRGRVRIKITKVIGNNGDERILTRYETCVANEQGSCSVEVVLQNGEIVSFEVENIGTSSASYKVAVDAESSFEQAAHVTVKSGYGKSTDWWSYTHENVPHASNGDRVAKVILSNFTDVNLNHINADLDLYTKRYATNDDISNNDITTASGSFDCRPYSGGNSVETCTTQYGKDSNNNIDEKVRVRVRGYYASNNQEKIVYFKLTTKTSRRASY